MDDVAKGSTTKARESEQDTASIVQPVLLVAYNGSTMSEEQLHMACRWAHDLGGSVRVLYVVALSKLIPLDAPVPPYEQERTEEILDRAEQIAARYGVPCLSVVDRARSVGEAIIADALDCRPHSIFMGLRDRNRRGITVMLSGTVRYVLQHAPCRVHLAYLPPVAPEQARRDDPAPTPAF